MSDKIDVLKFERAFLFKKRTWHRKALMIFGTLRCFVIANLECEKHKKNHFNLQFSTIGKKGYATYVS